VWLAGRDDDVEEDFVENAMIAMASTTPDAVIVYTVDGSLPSGTAGIKYTEAYEDTSFGKEVLQAISYAPGMLPSPIKSSPIFDIVHKCELPTLTGRDIFDDTSGPYTAYVEVTIHSSLLEEGGDCYYTTNGRDPVASPIFSSRYTQPFVISKYGTTEVKALVTKKGQADSDVKTMSFEVLEQVETPTFDVNSGTFTDRVTVHVESATPGARIRYTTDGSTPNAGSDEYNPEEGITLALPETGEETTYRIKAFARDAPDMGDSFVAESGVYTVQPQVDAPLIVPDPALGPFTNEVRVAIHCDTQFAEIHYTTDGSDPAARESTSQVYTGPFIMSNLSPEINMVRAVAIKPHMAMSPEATRDYVVKPEACVPHFHRDEGAYVEGVEVVVTCPVHHHGIPGKVHFIMVPSDDVTSEPNETSPVYESPIEMDVVGNITLRAVAMGPHVMASPVIQSPWYAIMPDPACDPDWYEPHTGNGTSEIEWDIFDRKCLPCPEGGTSPFHSKARYSCVAKKGWVGPPGGPFTRCPYNTYKDTDGDGECTSCPEHSGTEVDGGADITVCRSLPGSEGPDGGPFQLCPEGTFSNVFGAIKCTSCQPGGTTRGLVGEKFNKNCIAKPGYTNSLSWEEGPFVACPIGRYKTDYGPEPCKACPFCSTTEQVGASSAKQCVADIGCEGKGFGWGIGFTKCKTGTFKPNVGNGMCPPCPTDGSSDVISCGGAVEPESSRDYPWKDKPEGGVSR